MSVNISDLREALAAQLATVPGANTNAYRLTQPPTPCLMVVGVETIERTSFGQAADAGYAVTVTVQGVAAKALDKNAQKLVDEWLSPQGDKNVWAAIEADPTLNGNSDDVTVLSCDGTQLLTLEDGTSVYGSTWHVQIDI